MEAFETVGNGIIFMTIFVLYNFQQHGIEVMIRGTKNYTTLFSILYIFCLAVDFSWMIIGAVFSKRYTSEVVLKNFFMITWVYMIIGWLQLLLLPALFLTCTYL